MSAEAVQLRVLMPLMRHGERVDAGVILTMSPAEAADCLDSPKVELVDPGDKRAVQAARVAEVSALMRRDPNAPAGAPRLAHPDGPWVPARY